MPGESPEDALQAGAAIAATGRGLLYTQLGEAITSAQEANTVRDHYHWFFDQIRARRLPAQVSVKPTQLGLDLSIADCQRHCWDWQRRQSRQDQRSGSTWKIPATSIARSTYTSLF